MEYTMTNPCPHCPFRNDIPGYLTAARVREIRQGLERGDFPCHKTTKEVEYDDGESETVATEQSLHCAGALILKEKLGESSQMMRICERLGMYDHTKLNMEAPVFNSWREMEKAQPRR